MRTALAAIMVTIATLSLTSCGGSVDSPRDTGAETNTYRGLDITCIKDGMGNTKVRTCDYAAFYAAHPDLLAESADEADTEGVWWTTYRGENMPCYKEGLASNNTLSCDFAWFYALNPDLAPDPA